MSVGCKYQNKKENSIQKKNYFCENVEHAFLKAVVQGNLSIMILLSPFVSFQMCEIENKFMSCGTIHHKMKKDAKNLGFNVRSVNQFVNVFSLLTVCALGDNFDGAHYLISNGVVPTTEDFFTVLYQLNIAFVKLFGNVLGTVFMKCYHFDKFERSLGTPVSFLFKLFPDVDNNFWRTHRDPAAKVLRYLVFKGALAIGKFDQVGDKRDIFGRILIVDKDSNPQMVEHLLRNNSIDVNAVNSEEKRPLDYILNRGYHGTGKITLLLQHKVDMNLPMANGS